MHNVSVNAAERLEHACADAWPAVTEDTIGQWRLRAAGGFTGRANSALAAGDPGVPIRRALGQVRRFADAHRIPPVVQAVHGSTTEAALEAAGWRPHVEHPAGHDVVVLTGAVAPGASPDARVLDHPTAGWWSLVLGEDTPGEAQRHVLTGAPCVGYGVAEREGTTAAAGRGAVVGDMLHVARLAVVTEHRRRGLARALMDALGTWGHGLGATHCALQVSLGNDAALTLYDRLGFAEHHRYRYWVPGPGAR